MKKLLLAAAACSALFFTVGCSNEFTGGTHTTAADLREIYSTANNASLTGTNALTATVSFPSYTKSTTAATVATVTFTKPMAASSVSAVTLYAVSSATGATTTTPLVYTPVTDATVTLDEDDPEYMYVSAALSGDYYEVRVDPTTAVALNGQKLNNDSDAVQGEANDDVCSSEIVSAKTKTTTLTGVPYLPRARIVQSVTYIEADDGTYSTLSVTVPFVYVYDDATTMIPNATLPLKTFDSTIAAILSNHIKIQEYLPSTGVWSDIALTFSESTTTSTSATLYDATFKAADARDYVRYVETSLSTFATASNVYGCPLKVATTGYDGVEQFLNGTKQEYKDYVDGSSGYLLSHLSHNPAVSLLTLGYISTPTVKYGKIFITLAPAATWQAISIDDVTSTKTTTKTLKPFSDGTNCTFAGFDESTITAANFKVVNSAGTYELPITGVTMEKETVISASTTVTYKNVIVITLKDSTISSLSGYNIYVGPNVKTAAVAGVDGDGNATTARSYSLGSSVPATNGCFKGGWQKLY